LLTTSYFAQDEAGQFNLAAAITPAEPNGSSMRPTKEVDEPQDDQASKSHAAQVELRFHQAYLEGQIGRPCPEMTESLPEQGQVQLFNWKLV
jgi:hypothetical protein